MPASRGGLRGGGRRGAESGAALGEAAKEIKALIEDSVGKVEAGSALVNQSGRTLDDIVESVKRVTDIIAEIAAASEEQSTGIDQVNRAVAQMDQVVQPNAAQTEQLSSTAQTLASQAQQLQTLVARFKLDDGQMHATPAASPAMTLTTAPSPRPAPGRTPPPPLTSAVAPATNGHDHRNGDEAWHDDDDFEASPPGASATTRSGRSL